MRLKFLQKTRAFTLIELLVVIAIIGILTTLVMLNVMRAQANSRDSRRISDNEKIQGALEMYYNAHGAYPDSNNPVACGAYFPNPSWCNSVETSSSDGKHWIFDRGVSSTVGALTNYLDKDPVDPKGSTEAILLNSIAGDSTLSGRWSSFQDNGNWGPGGFLNAFEPNAYFYGSTEAGQMYVLVFTLEDNNNAFQKKDGVYMDSVALGGSVICCNGYDMDHFGDDTNGRITLGKDRITRSTCSAANSTYCPTN
jgi:general secretion pathway protein G